MKLQENHKEFAIKCFAEYMQRSEVVDAFMIEFEHDLPQPPPPPELPNYKEEIAGTEYEFSRDEYVKNKMDEISSRYFKMYRVKSPMILEKKEADYIEKFKLEFDKERLKEREKMYEEQLSEYQLIVDNHYMQIRRKLSAQLRRLNITHTQFPEKYRKLFNNSRNAFLKSRRNDNMTDIALTNDDNIRQELETIFGHVKNLMFLEREPKEVLKHVDTAHSILKTISAYNKQKREDSRNNNENNPTQ